MNKKTEIEAKARLSFFPHLYYKNDAIFPIVVGDDDCTALVQARMKDNHVLFETIQRYHPPAKEIANLKARDQVNYATFDPFSP